MHWNGEPHALLCPCSGAPEPVGARGADGAVVLPTGHPPGKEVMRSVIQFGLTWLDRLRSRLANEDGQGLAEYALILGLIAMVAIIALIFMGGQISDKLTVVGDTLASHAP